MYVFPPYRKYNRFGAWSRTEEDWERRAREFRCHCGALFAVPTSKQSWTEGLMLRFIPGTLRRHSLSKYPMLTGKCHRVQTASSPVYAPVRSEIWSISSPPPAFSSLRPQSPWVLEVWRKYENFLGALPGRECESELQTERVRTGIAVECVGVCVCVGGGENPQQGRRGAWLR